MTRGGACVPRRLVARALGVERFEERWLLSTVGPASGPPQGGWVFPTSPIPALVSRLPVAALGSQGAPDGIGEPQSVDGGMAPALAVRATVTAPASPPPDNLALPLVGAATAVGPNGSMLMATTGFPDALDLAVEGAFPAPGTAPTTTPTIQVDDSTTDAYDALATDGATRAGVATNADFATIADIATIPGANNPPGEVFPPVSLDDIPGPAAAVVASFAGSGGTVVTAEQAGGSTLASDLSGVSVAVPRLAGPLLPTSVAALFPVGVYGQTNITFSAAGGGNVLQVGGVAMTTAAPGGPGLIWFGGSDAPIPPMLSAVAIATPGTFRLAPLFARTVDGYPGIAAIGANAPGGAANSAIVVEIGTTSIAPSGPSPAIGNAGRGPATDSGPNLAVGRLAAMVTDRDPHVWRNAVVADTVEPEPRRMSDVAGPPGRVDPTPQRLGLIVDFRPFDRLAVEQTIDRLLGQLERLGGGLSSLRVPMDIAAELLALAVALTAWIVVPRMLRRSPAETGPAACDDATSLDGISGLAGGTSLEEP